MRIRSTKPEFWRSSSIAELDWDTRLVLKALESYVDDNGVGKDSIVIFCADAFPHDLANSPEVCAKVARSLSRLSDVNIIARYKVSGEELVYVRHWKQWQYIDKPKQGRYPRPDGSMNYRDGVDESICAGQGVTDHENREGPPKPRETFAKSSPKVPEECPQIQSGEQGNRGTGEQEPPYPPGDEPRVVPIRKTGSELVRARIANAPVVGSVLARQIAHAYNESLNVPLTAKLVGEISAVFDECLQAQIPPDAIAAGMNEWTRSDSWAPSQIPKFIHKAANRSQPTNGVGKPSEAAMSYQDAAEQLLAKVTTR